MLKPAFQVGEESKRVMETLLFCLFMIQYYTVHGLLKSLKSMSPKKSSILENETA